MSGSEVDKDLAKALQAAKKKPRNFAIIAKGAKILKLIVDKKPIKQGVLLQAKKEYQGTEIVKGIVRGDGSELVFQVVELPTLDDAKLKRFVTETTRLPLARFEATADLQEIDDESPDEQAQPTATAMESAPPTTEAVPDAPPAPPPPPAPRGAPPPPDSPEGKLLAALHKLGNAVNKALTVQPAVKDELIGLFKQTRQLIDAKDVAAAKESLLKLDARVRQVLTSGEAPSAPPEAPASPAQADTLKDWQAVRTTVVEQLRKLGAAIVAAKDPEAKDAIILLQAVVKNLTPQPDTPQKVAELERYLQTDDVIAEAEAPNPFGVAIEIRTPLLAALQKLKAAFAT